MEINMSKKIIYIFNNRLPTEKAHGRAITRQCFEFAKAGAEVELWYPRATNKIKQDLFNYYELDKIFKIKKIFSISLPHLIFSPGIIYRFRYFFFLITLFFAKKDKVAIYYTRHAHVVWLLSKQNCQVILEDHNWYPKNKIYKNIKLVKKADKIVVTTKLIKEQFVKYNFEPSRILVAPNGVDIDSFNPPFSIQQARKKLGLNQNKFIVLYSGHLYPHKGVYTLAKSAFQLDQTFEFVFIGGTDRDILKFKNFCQNKDNIKIIGRVNPSNIPLYLKSADILVIPNSAHHKLESSYSSPLKLAEYLAAGKPIIASSVPALKDVLSHKQAEFFEPDNASDLAKKIKKLYQDKNRRQGLSHSAKQKSQQFSWQNRTQKIINFIFQ